MPLGSYQWVKYNYHVLPRRARVDLGAMKMKVCSVFPKAPALVGPRHSLQRYTVYSTAPADWAIQLNVSFISEWRKRRKSGWTRFLPIYSVSKPETERQITDAFPITYDTKEWRWGNTAACPWENHPRSRSEICFWGMIVKPNPLLYK